MIHIERHPTTPTYDVTVRCDGCKKRRRYMVSQSTVEDHRPGFLDLLDRCMGHDGFMPTGPDGTWCNECHAKLPAGPVCTTCDNPFCDGCVAPVAPEVTYTATFDNGQSEVTRTTLNDLLRASERYLMLAYEDDVVQWHREFPEACKRADEERAARLRAAMQGMANVMRVVWYSLGLLYEAVDNMSDDGELRNTMLLGSGMENAASAEWSRRVREGVKALVPPGPRVYCEGDDE